MQITYIHTYIHTQIMERDEEIRDWNRHLTAVMESNQAEMNVVLMDNKNKVSARFEELAQAQDTIRALKERVAAQAASLDQLNVRFAEKEADFDGLTVRFACLHESNASALKAASEDANKRVAARDAEVRELTKRVSELEGEAQGLAQSTRDEFTQKLVHQREEIDRMHKLVHSLQAEIDTQNEAWNLERAEMKDSHQQVVAKLQAKFQRKDDAKVDEMLAKKIQECADMQARLAQKDSEMQEHGKRVAALEDSLNALNRLMSDKDSLVKELQALVADKDMEMGDLRVSLAALHRLNDATQSALHDAREDAKKQVSDRDSQIKSFEEKCVALQARVETLLEGWDKAATDLATQSSEIDVLSNRAVAAEAKIAEISADSAARLAEYEAKAAELRERLSATQESRATDLKEAERQFRLALTEKDLEVERLEQHVSVLTDSARDAAEESSRRIKEKVTAMHEAQKSAEEKQVQIMELKKALEGKDADVEDLKQKLKNLSIEKETQAAAVKTATEELNVQLADRNAEILKLTVQVNSKRDALDETARHLAELETSRLAEVDSFRAAIETLQGEVNRLQPWEQQALTEIAELQKALMSRDLEIDALQRRLREGAALREKQTSEYEALQAKLDEALSTGAMRDEEVQELNVRVTDMVSQVRSFVLHT
jgi:chromosome segregation ATPase